MNKIFLSGYLSRDPERKTMRDGLTVAKFGIAVTRTFSKDNQVDFFNLAAFGNTAEFVCKYFKKGMRAIVEGKLQTYSYTDKNFVKRTDFTVAVDNIEFADSKKKDSGNADNYDDAPQDNDLPF